MKTITIKKFKYELVKVSSLFNLLPALIGKELEHYQHKTLGELYLCKETGKAYQILGM